MSVCVLKVVIRSQNSPLLNDSSQFTDTATLFTENVLCSGGHDDDFCTRWCHTYFNAGVTILSELASQEFVQFSFEDASGDELNIIVDMKRLEVSK